ncbi:MAG TPA: metal-dependent transcriptional regulator [Acidimicrobiales bacterium]|nr:metal-dependent transcriptional regulator [Acidimicrobiales bacterium]
MSQHPPLEEYLETVLELDEEGVVVTQARLAERLGHSAPTVSQMVRRLTAEGYLEVDHRVLALTPKGRAQGESVIRKHRLAERLLTDVIGLAWEKAHVEAGRWEHVISDEVEGLLVRLLGNPTTCPHGNPIPGAGPAERDLSSLDRCRPGDQIRLARITEQVELDAEALTYLATHGFIPGRSARVQSRAPDGTLVLELGDGQETIAVGPSMAEQLYVAATA